MNPAWWTITFVLLVATARAAIDIAVDRVPQRSARVAAAWGAGFGFLGLVNLLSSPAQFPLALTAILYGAANAGQAWLLRDLPRDTLPPVRY